MNHSLRIYPCPMVWPFLPRPWPDTMVSIPLRKQKALEIKGFLGLERPFLDLVSQTPRPRGRGRPSFAEICISWCYSGKQWIETPTSPVALMGLFPPPQRADLSELSFFFLCVCLHSEFGKIPFTLFTAETKPWF